MCGIAGFLRLNMDDKAARKLAVELLRETESRGRDATGIWTTKSARYNQDDDLGILVKSNCEASKFIEKFMLEADEFGKSTLLHCRSATNGEPEDNHNNHPVISDNWVLIHNGVMHMKRLKDYEYKGLVDSEVLLSYLETFGIRKALGAIDGSAAVAIQRLGDESIYLFRNTPPISIGLVKGKAIIFASTPQIIFDACDKVFGRFWGFPKVHVMECPKDKLVKMSPSGKPQFLAVIKDFAAPPDKLLSVTPSVTRVNTQGNTGFKPKKPDSIDDDEDDDEKFVYDPTLNMWHRKKYSPFFDFAKNSDISDTIKEWS